jgi:hypothetical protein
MHPIFVLGTDSSNPKNIGSIFLWSGVLIAFLLVAFAAYSYFKRWMTQVDEPGGAGFTLSDLRELHRQGKMSDAEFEQTKAMMLGSAKKMADQMPAVLPRKPGNQGAAASGDGTSTPPIT